MKKTTTIATIVGVVIIVAVIGYQVNETMWQKTSTQDYYDKNCEVGCEGVSHVVYPDNPQKLYGLQINKDKYILGESIYVIVTDIPEELKTRAIFYTPSGTEYYTIKIDGEKTSGFKQYFKPQLSVFRNLCNVEDLVGDWTVMFEDNPTEILNFEVTSEYLPGSESFFDPESCGKAMAGDPLLDPTITSP
tara:strand:- start:222 stop:791 length:570 start_codon:yes stop_codon:yes gene_type:complete